MSKQKDIIRAISGNTYRNNTSTGRYGKSFICAYCGKLLTSTFESVTGIAHFKVLYFHKDCPHKIGQAALDKVKLLDPKDTDAVKAEQEAGI